MINKIINASAGTGKTQTIINAALEGVKTEKEIQERLASTVFLSFSTSAVEEIKSRLYKETTKSRVAKSGLFEELSTLPEFRAYTIHGFAVELAKMLRYELGMPSNIEFLPMDDYTVWKNTVSEYFRANWSMEMLKANLKLEDTALKALCDAFYLLSDQYQVKRFIQDKGDALFFINGLGDADCGKIDADKAIELLAGIGIDIKKSDSYDKISKKVEEQLYEIKKNFELLKDFIDENSRAISELKEKIPTLQQQHAIDKNTAELTEYLARYKKLSAAAGMKEILALLDGCAGLLISIINDISERSYLPSLLKGGVFDFDAIVYLVIKLIKNKGKGWLMERLKEEGFSFDRIYIDEAQDSDIIQNYLVTILSEDDDKFPVSVTVVGDTKQSIYQWRSAYPEEFRAFYNEAKELKGKKRFDDLKTTWRLENEGTLGFLNGLFNNFSTVSQGLWDYEPARDALDENSAKTKSKKPNVKIIRLFKNTDLSQHKDFLQKCVSSGEIGILGRSRQKIKKSGLLTLDADFKYRTRLEKGDEDLSDLELNDTFYPEYFIVRSLLYTQVANLASVLPQILLFTPPGRLAMSNMKVKDETTFPEIVKAPHWYITELYRTFYTSKASKTAYNLLSRFGLWEYMWHATDDGPSTDIKPEVLSRNINSLLAVVYLYEVKMSNSTFSVEDLLEELNETATVPYEWYGMPEKGSGNTVEISTVHSAKGLQYDNAIVIDDFDSALVSEPNLMNREFSYLYNVSFKNMLSGKQKIKVQFFPYIGSTVAKLIKYMDEKDKTLWPGAVSIFENVNRRIVSEKFNLLYVALTRTRDGLVIIDMPKGVNFKTEKMDGNKLRGNLSNSLPEGFEAEPATNIKPEAEEVNSKEIYYMKLSENKKDFPVLQGSAAMTVRDYVTLESGLKVRSKKKKTAAEIALNIETGVEVHALLEQTIKNSRDLSGLQAEMLKHKPASDESEATKKAFDMLTSPNVAKELADIEPQIKTGIRPEVPVWGIKEGVLVKGVMDGLAVTETKCSVVEYKTVFDGDGDFQEKFGKEQVKVYAEFIEEIFKGRQAEGLVVSIKDSLDDK